MRAGAEPETARRMDVEGGTHGRSIQRRGRGAGAAAASRGVPGPGADRKPALLPQGMRGWPPLLMR